MLLGIKNSLESKIYSNGNYSQVGGNKKEEQNTEEV
jgi:hypothetical protein